MQFQFSFKQMDVSTALQSYAEEKLRIQIEKFVTKPIEAHVTFSIENRLHIAHCSITGGDGFSVEVEHSCQDMYGSVDHMLDKLTTQLKRKKDRLKGHKSKSSRRSPRYGSNSDFDIDCAEIDAADIIKFEQARRKLRTGS